MTPYRLNCLLIALILWMLCALPLAHGADLDAHVAGYAVVGFAGSMGYEQPDVGVRAEGQVKYGFAELWGYGHLDNGRKRDSESGYSYSAGVQARGFYKWLYLLGAYKYAGYRSEFQSGTVWEKAGDNYGIGLGARWDVEGHECDVHGVYYFQEHSSPNRVQSTTLDARVQVYGPVWALGQAAYSTWDQGTERWNGWTGQLGIGLRW